MHDMFERHHRTGVPAAVHDAGIQRQVAVPVRITSSADARRFRIFLDDANALLDGVEDASSLPEYFHPRFVDGKMKIPGMNEQRTGTGAVLRSGLPQSHCADGPGYERRRSGKSRRFQEYSAFHWISLL